MHLYLVLLEHAPITNYEEETKNHKKTTVVTALVRFKSIGRSVKV